MGGEWETMPLRDAGVALIDCDHRTPPAADSGYPYVAIPQLKDGRIALDGVRRITAEHFVEWTRKAKPQAHDVVLSRRCNPGETAFVPDGLEFALGQNLVLLRADGRSVFPPFLRWLVRSPMWWEQVNTFINVGAVFESLKCKDIPQFPLLIPPLPEQKRIAHVLVTLDDKIELHRRMNATLEGISRAIFKSWFVDFDPVRQKAAGQQPVGMDAQTAALFPDSFEESEIGEMPQGWSEGVVGDYADLNPESWSKAIYPDEVRYVDLSSTKWGEVEAIETHERHSAPSRAQRILRPGDTIFGTVRPGNGSFAMVEDDGLTGSTGFAVLRPKCGEFHEYVYLATTIAENIDRLAHLADGGAYPAIRPEVVADTPLTAAPRALVAKFSDCTAACFKQIARNRREARTLAALRDTLLPKLLSGEIHVPEAEQAAEEAMT